MKGMMMKCPGCKEILRVEVWDFLQGDSFYCSCGALLLIEETTIGSGNMMIEIKQANLKEPIPKEYWLLGVRGYDD